MSDSPRTSLSHLGFIGLGGMGARMASRLLNTGYHVTVYNRTRRRAEDLEVLGASIAESPCELARSADIVLSSVAAQRPRPSNYVYGASKAGLDAFARGLQLAAGQTGISF